MFLNVYIFIIKINNAFLTTVFSNHLDSVDLILLLYAVFHDLRRRPWRYFAPLRS
jgi:hypothetical protein